MKRIRNYKMLSCVLLLTMILSINNITYACWNTLTVDEMIEKSDAILIGEIVKEIGETKDEHPEIMWKVKVDYYLKGEIREKYLTVYTPSKDLSIHYDLGKIGEDVLLFMRAKEDHGTPLSPQGVITITIDEHISDDSNIISGKDLITYIKLNDGSLDEESKVELEEFIKSSKVFLPNAQPQNTHNWQKYLYIIIGIGILIVVLKYILNQRRK